MITPYICKKYHIDLEEIHYDEFIARYQSCKNKSLSILSHFYFENNKLLDNISEIIVLISHIIQDIETLNVEDEQKKNDCLILQQVIDALDTRLSVLKKLHMTFCYQLKKFTTDYYTIRGDINV